MTPSPTRKFANKFVDEIINDAIKGLAACKNFEANFFKKDLCKKLSIE